LADPRGDQGFPQLPQRRETRSVRKVEIIGDFRKIPVTEGDL
jgi:hypothetical protein